MTLTQWNKVVSILRKGQSYRTDDDCIIIPWMMDDSGKIKEYSLRNCDTGSTILCTPNLERIKEICVY